MARVGRARPRPEARVYGGWEWIVFGLDNGHPQSKRYCWCFETRKLACEHIAWQQEQRNSARLSRPMKYVSAQRWSSRCAGGRHNQGGLNRE